MSKKKDLGFTKEMAEKFRISQKSIPNHLRVGSTIEEGLFPEDILERFKNKEISRSKMLEFLIKSDKGNSN